MKLDIQLPKESIQEVQTVYDEEFFVSHRGKKHKGWESTCIHGIDGAYWKTMSGKQYGYESDSDDDIFLRDERQRPINKKRLELIKQYHPDKLLSLGLPEEFLKNNNELIIITLYHN